MIGYEYEFLVREGDTPLKARVVKKENPAQELLKIWRKEGLAGIWKARDF